MSLDELFGSLLHHEMHVEQILLLVLLILMIEVDLPTSFKTGVLYITVMDVAVVFHLQVLLVLLLNASLAKYV